MEENRPGFEYRPGNTSQSDILDHLRGYRGSKFTCKQIALQLKASPNTIRRNVNKLWPKYVQKERVSPPGHNREYVYWARK